MQHTNKGRTDGGQSPAEYRRMTGHGWKRGERHDALPQRGGMRDTIAEKTRGERGYVWANKKDRER